MHRTTVGVGVVATVLLFTVASAGAAAATTGDDPITATTDWDNVTLTQELHLTPDAPGELEVMVQVDLPDRMTDFELRVPRRATVIDTDGFEQRDPRIYEWNGNGHQPTITYDLAVNETARGSGPERGVGTYLYADTGQWALVSPSGPSVRYSFEYTSGDNVNVGVDRHRTVDGEGVASEVMAFLGPYETDTRNAHGQTFDLIVPETAEMESDPKRVLDVLVNASDRLRVGDRDERVTTIVAPTNVDWAVRGLQSGDSDMWVEADERVAVADNTWLHEYVHTRQRLNTTASTEWLIEATATYHAAELALEDDLTDFESFRAVLERGADDRYDDVVLGDPATWTALAEYDKGGLAAGALDRQIRLATDRTSEFEAVFATLNDGKQLSHAAFLDAVGDASDGTVRSTADEYVRTSATLSTWSRQQHEDAFGPTPASFTFTIAANSDTYRIEGPYRNVSVDSLPPLVPGETVTIPVSVTNVGGTAGEYDIALTIDGTAAAGATGTLAAGDSTTIHFEHTFEAPGRYRLGVGSNERTVSVTEPDDGRVQSVAASETTLDAPGPVTLTATVENLVDIPSIADVTFTRDGAEIADRTVSLGPGETKTIEVATNVSDPGQYVFGANGETVSVVVDPATFTYELTDGASFDVEGDYRTDSTDAIPPLVVGETLTVPVTVTNDGGMDGDYAATLSIDGHTVTRADGALPAGSSTTVRLSHTFEQPGRYQLTIGSTETTVTVAEPATAAVRSVEADRTELDGAGVVTLTATVGNDADVPARTTLAFTRDGTTVTETAVTLEPGETGTISTSIELDAPGTYELSVGSQTTTVTVRETGETPSSAETPGDGPAGTTTTGPGFTVALALIAVVFVALVRR